MRRYIKKVNCRASAANGQPFSIRTEGDCVNLFLHERNAKHLASRVHVPQFHFTTIASRSQQTTVRAECNCPDPASVTLSLIHISEPTRLLSISYAVFCLKKKN